MNDCWTSVGLLATLILIYFYMVRKFNFWAKRGIPSVKPTAFVGEILIGKKPMVYVMNSIYTEIKGHGLGFGGLYQFSTPILMVTSPELIRDTAVKSFDFFHDRVESISTKGGDPLFYNALPLLKGEKWRLIRTKLSPAFTASKLKGMIPHLSKCASKLAEFLVARDDAKTQPIELKGAFSRMTNDMIATAAFGMETNAVQNPKEMFYEFAQKIANFDILRVVFITLFPRLMATIGISITPRKVANFFTHIIKSTMEYRTRENISRPDMLQLLMAAQKGQLKSEAGEEVGSIGEDPADSELHKKHMTSAKKGDLIGEITDEVIAAQAFFFFLAGFDSVSSVLSFLAHELAVNPDVQERLQEEIDSTFTDVQLTYEAVINMKYLDMVVSETLRMYPPALATDRTCMKSYKIPGTNKVIEAGTAIFIPIYAVQRDPEHFPDPDKFDPERFSEENRAFIKPYTYMPFGVGPHNCIGMRLALIELKLCVIHLLASCNLEVSAKTDIPVKFARPAALMPENGIWLLTVPRENPTFIQ